MAIVADTHAIIWYLVEPDRLSQVALEALEGAITAGEPVYISEISVIEIYYLIEKRRISSDLLQRILVVLNESDPSLIVVPIDLAISIAVELTTRDSRSKDPSFTVNCHNLVEVPSYIQRQAANSESPHRF